MLQRVFVDLTMKSLLWTIDRWGLADDAFDIKQIDCENFAFTEPQKIHLILYKWSVKFHHKTRTSFPFHRPSRRPCLHTKLFRNSSTMKVRVFPLSIVRKPSQCPSLAVRHMHFSVAFEKSELNRQSARSYRVYLIPELNHCFTIFFLNNPSNIRV